MQVQLFLSHLFQVPADPSMGCLCHHQAAPAVPKIAVPPRNEQFPHREQGKVFPVVSLRIWDGGGSLLVKHSVEMGKTKPPLLSSSDLFGKSFPSD